MMKKPKTFGKFLKQRRVKAKITQINLAHRLGYSPQFVANWERGACIPPLNILKKLSQELIIPTKQLQSEFLKYHAEVLKAYLSKTDL